MQFLLSGLNMFPMSDKKRFANNSKMQLCGTIRISYILSSLSSESRNIIDTAFVDCWLLGRQVIILEIKLNNFGIYFLKMDNYLTVYLVLFGWFLDVLLASAFKCWLITHLKHKTHSWKWMFKKILKVHKQEKKISDSSCIPKLVKW